MFDIDGLNRITYEYGYLVGDEVLRRIGAMLAAEQGLAVRTGGDEFALLLRGPAAANAEAIAARYLGDFAAMQIDQTPMKIACSFGIAARKNGETIESMTARAETALDVAKHAGGACVVVANGVAVG